MIFFIPNKIAPFLQGEDGIEINPFDSEFSLLYIKKMTPEVLLTLFYRGAEYGAEEYHKLAKEKLQKPIILNKFGLN